MLKGKAIIELTDVNTGQVETYEENNMITNVLQEIITLNPDCFRDRSAIGDSIYPLFTNSLGGILLFNQLLEEDPKNYNVPSNNNIIGYSNRSVNTSSDAKRGSYNSAESGYLDSEKKGYKYVYDFNTTQGNGLISSLALTSNSAGGRYLGNTLYQYKNNLTQVIEQQQTSVGSNTSPLSLDTFRNMLRQNAICSFDIPNNKAYAVWYPWTANHIIIDVLSFPFDKLDIGFSPMTAPGSRVIHSITLTTQTNYGTAMMFFPDDYYAPQYIWGFSWNSNSSGNATILWIKIKLEDYTFEEGSWTLENIQLYISGLSEYVRNYNVVVTNSYNYSQKNCILYKNYLYCVNYTKTGIYKISIEDPTNFKFLPYPENRVHTVDSFSGYQSRGYYTCTFNIVNDVIYFPNGYILNDTIIPVLSNNNTSSVDWNALYSYNYGLHRCAAPGLKCGPYLFSFYGYASSSDEYAATLNYYYRVYLEKDYLATINNLENPIEKTNDKTMKITYILTEIDEEEEI